MNEMIRVAFVGLGAMGLPMASNLLGKGFTVAGFDLSANALDALEEAGGKRAGSASEAAIEADALILMVVNAAQAEAVLFEGGALEKLRANGVVALMATCPPAAVEAIEERVRQAGRRLIDAPVSGGVAGAKAATLTIMAAGPRDTFEAVKPLFDAMGDKVFHVGERPGQGAMVKTVNQLLCGVRQRSASISISSCRS
jgi:3-hydroxyisobutyrate dehydrogenase